MSREISFFNDYHQKENSVTNYCGLMMKMVYEESPRLFEEVLATLLGGKLNLKVGPNFSQQKIKVSSNPQKNTASIPDLAISQEAFSVFFENKLTDWFYEAQILRHVNNFGSTDKKILFLMTNWEDEGDSKFETEIKKAKDAGVIVKCISFEDLVGSLQNISKLTKFENLLEEFQIYLDEKGLLPRWKYLLDIVSCKSTLNEIEDGAYICPNTGGAYSHRRARYFGPYANKKVDKIYLIDAIVTFETNFDNPQIKWDNRDPENKKEDLKIRAKMILNGNPGRLNEIKNTPLQVFLLSEGTRTNFSKDSSGGMMQSKIYFWDIAKDLKEKEKGSVSELAKKLNNKRWEDFRP